MVDPDFIAFNYYNTATVKESKIDDSQCKFVGGDQQIATGDLVVFKGAHNDFLQKD